MVYLTREVTCTACRISGGRAGAQRPERTPSGSSVAAPRADDVAESQRLEDQDDDDDDDDYPGRRYREEAKVSPEGQPDHPVPMLSEPAVAAADSKGSRPAKRGRRLMAGADSVREHMDAEDGQSSQGR